MRIGSGHALHRFGPGDHVMLGGVRIAHDRGLVAHSDGDVVLHALMDALLGAAGAGDIGQHFPDSDARWRGASSLRLLEEIRAMLDGKGARLVNVDATLIAEAPKVAPHVSEMRESLGRALGVTPERISVKATTNETIGAVGREEGIAAMAVALVEVEVT